MEPKVFIGCSNEAKDVGRAIQDELSDIAQVIPWHLVFKAGDYTFEKLLLEVKNFDFGIFLITPDDFLELRGKKYLTARDNVIFEAGIFLSELGRKRTLLVAPFSDPDGGPDFHLPSDLAGLTLIKYRPFEDKKDLKIRLGPACNQIREIVKEFEQLPDERLREYLTVLSGGLVHLLRHLSYRSISIEDAGRIIAHFNGEDTGCKHAWERAGRYAVRALTAMKLATSDSHGCTISGAGRALLEHRVVRERFSRALGVPLIGIP